MKENLPHWKLKQQTYKIQIISHLSVWSKRNKVKDFEDIFFAKSWILVFFRPLVSLQYLFLTPESSSIYFLFWIISIFLFICVWVSRQTASRLKWIKIICRSNNCQSESQIVYLSPRQDTRTENTRKLVRRKIFKKSEKPKLYNVVK